MKQLLILPVLVLITSLVTFSQPRLEFSIGTGNDDFRENSKLIITVIFFNPDQTVTTREIAGGRRFADRTTVADTISLRDGVLINDIQEVRLEYIPDPASFPKESDKWWFTHFKVNFRDPATNVTTGIYEENITPKKFESQETWSTGVLPNFTNARTKTIIVIDEALPARPVYNAEVYLRTDASSNWIALGSTNYKGELVTTQTINSSSKLIAKKRIHEQEYYRSFHSLNSNKNWNYRVNLTNLDIDAEGKITPDIQGITTRTIQLKIKRSNTLIGCNVVVCSEWSLTPSEIETYKNRLLEASDFLYNSTDGQFYFEQITITDKAQYHWADSDIRIKNQPMSSFRAHVPNQTGGFLGWNIAGTCIEVANDDPGSVYAHEFGHYGLDLQDEYSDNDRSICCTAATLGTYGKFSLNMPQASCMMWSQWNAPKLCSIHFSNPHANGTKQLALSCWDKIKQRYNWSRRETSYGQVEQPLWRILSPFDRDGIPGTLQFGQESYDNIPIIKPLFSIQTSNVAGSIGEHRVKTEGIPFASPLPNVQIYTISPQFSFHGQTDNQGILSIAGSHSGDEILAMHPSGIGALATVTAGTSQTNILLNVLTSEQVNSTPLNSLKTNRTALANADFQLITIDKEKSIVSLKFPKKLKSGPTVAFINEGINGLEKLPEVYAYSHDSASFLLNHIGAYKEGIIIIQGEYEDNTSVRQVEQVEFIANDLDNVFALNGLVSIRQNDKNIHPQGLFINTTRKYVDSLPKDIRLFGIPFQVKLSNQAVYNAGVVLELRLPRGIEGGIDKNISSETIHVYRFNTKSKAWEYQPEFKLNKTIGIVAATIHADGIYALVSSLKKVAVFEHVTNDANTVDYRTTFNHSLLNHNPDALIFVAPLWKEKGDLNPVVPFGVQFDGNRWTLFNQNKTNLAKKTDEHFRYAVLAFPNQTANCFVHTVNPTNRSGYSTTLQHELLDGNPKAIILVTQRFGVYNNHEVEVYYSNGRWKIINQDRSPLTDKAQFNVLIVNDRLEIKNITSFQYTQTKASQIAVPGYSAILNPALTNNDNYFVFASKRWTGAPNSNSYNIWYDHPSDGYTGYKDGYWFIYNSSNQLMPINTSFNVLAISKNWITTSVSIFTPQPLGTLCPTTRIRGDADFGGGPSIKCSVDLRVKDNTVEAIIYFKAEETKGDNSTVEQTFIQKLWSAPENTKIESISSPKIFKISFIGPKAGIEIGVCNNGEVINVPIRKSRELVKSIQIIGDTGGSDISNDSNCECDTQISRIEFNPITVNLSAVK